MSEYQEFTGKTVEEALRNARETFGVAALDDLDFEILTPGSRGVLGMGAEPARIVAAPRAALGGATPRREAAASKPLPAPPPREERGPRPFDRDRGPRDRGPGPHPDRGERPPQGDRLERGPRPEPASRPEGAARPEPARAPSPPERPEPARAPSPPERPEASPVHAPREAAGPGREERGPRDRDHAGRPERRTAVLSEHEQDEVAAARASLSEEREEIQAAEASPEALAAGKELLEQLMALIGYKVTVGIETGETARLNIRAEGEESEALGALIGRKGERLSALQHLVNLMLSRRMGAWTRVLVDVEDYRGRRERQLIEIANRAAERVIETGKMLQLEPMPPLERRWVHLALRSHPGVATQSIGEEPSRRVVVLRRNT